MLELPVRVVDPEGRPVAKAKVTPWALRCSQGHGLWRKDDDRAGGGPLDAFTDERGIATVLYPEFRNIREQIRTLAVSLLIDHPDFAYTNDLHIDVPLETAGPHEFQLTAGVTLGIRPLLDNEPADLDDLFALWSDGRSLLPGAAPTKLPDGSLRIPAMPPGKNSLLLIKLAGDRAIAFSKIIDTELQAGERKTIDVTLRASLRISGVLSDNVPRPVRGGRLKVQTLAAANAGHERVHWFTWAPIQSDGTFTIDGWPIGERLQLIAMCDGYIATSGSPPDVVQQPYNPQLDAFNRPQVFDPSLDESIEIAMTPMVPCLISLVDDDDQPVAGVKVASWPNVGWWNNGSQIYCHWLVRCERLLHGRNYFAALDEVLPSPFEAITDARGQATLKLPVGTQQLAVKSDVYELPIFLGRRTVRVEVAAGTSVETVLRLQPRGTEKLGEWDKLAGVVFGCSTREGRRICALPSVQKQMEQFATRFREAKSQRDPQLLAESYTFVADAFDGVGDPDEAAKWRSKAAEQKVKASARP